MTLKKFFIIVSFFYVTYIYPQKKLDSISKDDIVKNILIYRISKMNSDIDTCANGSPLNFAELLPSNNQELNIHFKESNKRYPDNNITLYELETNFSFINYTKYLNGQEKMDIINFVKSDFSNINYFFLIGINKLTNKIIYISGDLFKNCISEDFDLLVDKPNTFNCFLDLKLYNYQLKNIKYVKRNKKYLFFKAFSETQKTNIYIKVNIKNFDLLKLNKI